MFKTVPVYGMYTKLRSSGILSMMYTETQERARKNSVCYGIWESPLIKVIRATARSITNHLTLIMFV